MIVSLKSIFAEMAAAHPEIKKVLLEGQIEKIWQEIAPAGQPAGLKSGKLYIEVESPIWANELRFQKKEFIEKLNARLGERVAEEIVFRLPQEQKSERAKKVPKKNCPDCGVQFSGASSTCSVCAQKKRSHKTGKIKRLLKAQPWIDFRQATKELPGLLREDLEKERKAYGEKLQDEMNLILRELTVRKNGKLNKELKMQAIAYAALRTQAHPKDIDLDTVRRWAGSKISKQF